MKLQCHCHISSPPFPFGAVSEDPEPQDRYHGIYFAMLLAGVGFLLPYNSFITDVDYLHHKYPGRAPAAESLPAHPAKAETSPPHDLPTSCLSAGTSIVFDMSLTYILVALVAVILNNALVELLSLHTRISVGELGSPCPRALPAPPQPHHLPLSPLLQVTSSPWAPCSLSASAMSGWSSSPAGKPTPSTWWPSGWWLLAAQVCCGLPGPSPVPTSQPGVFGCGNNPFPSPLCASLLKCSNPASTATRGCCPSATRRA